ncbi:MAG TPA: hypothetical protein VGG74_14725 [Kofleriaceae bacterium]|jgi:pyruvate/2-oxoglutarate dehydrogenase complex dihydrolipoamide acyltransferase (E2) component
MRSLTTIDPRALLAVHGGDDGAAAAPDAGASAQACGGGGGGGKLLAGLGNIAGPIINLVQTCIAKRSSGAAPQQQAAQAQSAPEQAAPAQAAPSGPAPSRHRHGGGINISIRIG